jgi:hypothetical protein
LNAVAIILAVELAVGLLGSAAFVYRYWWRSDWRSTPVGRNLMARAALDALELALLFVLVVGARLWPWSFVILFGALDVVVLRRPWLLLRAQRGG